MSAVYDIGTVSVTNGSAVVTGAGTAWVGVLRAGWLIHLPNGEVGVVDQVVSATELLLLAAYAGTTQTGQTYWAIATGGVAASLAAAVEARNADVQTMLDGPGSGRFGDGTLAQPGVAFAADQDTGLRRVSSNKVAITTGGVDRAVFNPDGTMTGPVVQDSATDTTAGRLMRADFGYSRGNILGTVSQSGGVPTVAIIERGNNANGSYTRFADGTQICWRSITIGFNTASNCSGTWTFPVAFLAGSTPVVEATFNTGTMAPTPPELGLTRAFGTSVTARSLFQYRVNGQTDFVAGNTVTLDVMAFGRWF